MARGLSPQQHASHRNGGDDQANRACGQKPIGNGHRTGAASRVLRCLVAAHGGVVSDRYLNAATSGGAQTVKVAVRHLRERGFQITRAGNVGYRLNDIGGEVRTPAADPVVSVIAASALHATQHGGTLV